MFILLCSDRCMGIAIHEILCGHMMMLEMIIIEMVQKKTQRILVLFVLM